MRFKQLIWDFDGTLFDTYPAMVLAFQQALAAFSVSADREEISSYMRQSMKLVIHHYTKLHNLPKQQFIPVFSQLNQTEDQAHIQPFPHVKAFLSDVLQAKGANFIYTHRGKSTWFHLENQGMSDWFTEVVTAENGFARKPSPDGILYLLEKYALAPEDTLYIGDRELDITSAHSAGISACLFAGQQDTPDTAAEYVIADIAALYTITGITPQG